MLDRLIAAGGAGHPGLADLAREVRYRWLRPARSSSGHGRRSMPRSTRGSRRSHGTARPGGKTTCAALVDCPQPLVGLLCPRLEAATPALRRTHARGPDPPLLPHPRASSSSHVRDSTARSCATAEYEFEGRRIHLLVTHAPWAQLPRRGSGARTAHRRRAGRPRRRRRLLPLARERGERQTMRTRCRAAARAVLAAAGFHRRLRRIVVAVAARGGGSGSATCSTSPSGPGPNGYDEERVYRGLHPMMGKRLQLWRLRNFDLERLPSAEDVYLFRGVARENPKDERLFALAEVRDLTPVRDAAGRVVQLPAPRAHAHGGAGRHPRFQAAARPSERLHWNRVLLYVWPPLDAARPTSSIDMVRRLAPADGRARPREGASCARACPTRTAACCRDARARRSRTPAGRGFTIRAYPPGRSPPAARRVRAEGRAPAPARPRLPVRDRCGCSRRPTRSCASDFPPGDVRRARPRRGRPRSCPCGAAYGSEHGQRRGRRHPQRHHRATRRAWRA